MRKYQMRLWRFITLKNLADIDDNEEEEEEGDDDEDEDDGRSS